MILGCGTAKSLIRLPIAFCLESLHPAPRRVAGPINLARCFFARVPCKETMAAAGQIAAQGEGNGAGAAQACAIVRGRATETADAKSKRAARTVAEPCMDAGGAAWQRQRAPRMRPASAHAQSQPLTTH